MNTIEDAKNAVLEVAKFAAEKRIEAENAKDIARAAKKHLAEQRKVFIATAFDSFVSDMRYEWKMKDYIYGSYTSPFTKHIQRHYFVVNYRDPDNSDSIIYNKIKKARLEYNKALANLNKTFVELCINETDGMRRQLLNFATLKNIRKET